MYFECVLISECLRAGSPGNKLWNGDLHAGCLWGVVANPNLRGSKGEKDWIQGKFENCDVVATEASVKSWGTLELGLPVEAGRPDFLLLYGPVIKCGLPPVRSKILRQQLSFAESNFWGGTGSEFSASNTPSSWEDEDECLISEVESGWQSLTWTICS